MDEAWVMISSNIGRRGVVDGSHAESIMHLRAEIHNSRSWWEPEDWRLNKYHKNNRVQNDICLHFQDTTFLENNFPVFLTVHISHLKPCDGKHTCLAEPLDGDAGYSSNTQTSRAPHLVCWIPRVPIFSVLILDWLHDIYYTDATHARDCHFCTGNSKK